MEPEESGFVSDLTVHDPTVEYAMRWKKCCLEKRMAASEAPSAQTQNRRSSRRAMNQLNPQITRVGRLSQFNELVTCCVINPARSMLCRTLWEVEITAVE